MNLREVEMKHLDVLVVGPPNSGKTTLCKTFQMMSKMTPEQQQQLIEVQKTQENLVNQQAKFRNMSPSNNYRAERQGKQKKHQQRRSPSKSPTRRQEPFEIQDLGCRCYKVDHRLSVANSSESIRICLWDPCTTELEASARKKSQQGINSHLRELYLTEQVYHSVIIAFDISDSTSLDAALDQYQDLIKISKKAAKAEKKFSESQGEDPAANPYRHMTKFAQIPVVFVGLKMDLVSTGFVQKCVTTDELEKYLAENHKAPSSVFEVNAFQNIGINYMVDWVVRQALVFYPFIEAAKFRGIDRFAKPVGNTSVNNSKLQSLLMSGVDQSNLEDDANREGVIEPKVAKRQNDLWDQQLETEERTQVKLKDACTIF